ncbi:MAG: hypothetical protein K8S27_02555 [Candidatus Omnitrophica bacterium]|nr:hypothetical protein [Candidatus Omnitrophota bacterium]
MLKKLLVLTVIVSAALMLSIQAAHAQTFTVAAEVPVATSATFSVSRVTNAGNTWTAHGTNLDFGALVLVDVAAAGDPPQYVFLADDVFYAIDIGSNGVGNPDIDISYLDTANPNGTPGDNTGLEVHGSVSWAQVIQGTPDTVNVLGGSNYGTTNSVSGEITDESIATGFFRVMVGMATGDEIYGPLAPFSPADAAGIYSGTLTLTATFD